MRTRFPAKAGPPRFGGMVVSRGGGLKGGLKWGLIIVVTSEGAMTHSPNTKPHDLHCGTCIYNIYKNTKIQNLQNLPELQNLQNMDYGNYTKYKIRI